ncbi:DBH-like monooxygenase protein 1 [Orchesella cincta]|uniref:DBH-like monooxygenase protein 1 n=1 Tax=Orchesella cincta TaxID=48709 RepID=A0A1D2MAU5_ORCCI|nr:DBH-like monooxygenase protein 1 [Orchesella cincta]
MNILLLCNLHNVFGQNSSSSSSTLTFHQREVLDSELSLEWNVSLESKTILFTIETTRGGTGGSYVALGLTKKGRVEQGNDVVVTGIEANGRPFVADMVALNERSAVQDRNQDWKLVDGRRLDNGGSRITIQRGFDACDEQDTTFNTDLIHVVWGQGGVQSVLSQLEINFQNGSRQIYFLDPIIVPKPPAEGENVGTFRISRRFLLPPRHTSYWCSVHRVNATLPTKHHIVGFAPYFENELGRKHIHHQVIFRCIAPPGADSEQMFQPFADQIGEECYINNNTQLPYFHCAEYVMESAVGGKAVPFSDAVGFALGGEPNPVEYFLYQTHYDNPEVRADMEIETGVDFIYSSRLRPNEGGVLLTGLATFGQWAMPPLTTEFDVAGSCNPRCTTTMFPPEGVDVFAIRLHSHLTRRVRIKHFRGGVELPYIQNDDNYDFNYQQWRWLYNPVKLLPGDQVTVQCGFDNTWKNDSSSTVSGFSTRDEMDLDSFDKIIHSAADPNNVGLTYTQLVTDVTGRYTQEEKIALENEQLYGEHVAFCPNFDVASRIVHYYSIIQQVLPSGVNIPLPEALTSAKISDKTISTPGGNGTARYPRDVPKYIPPKSCPVTSPPSTQFGGGTARVNSQVSSNYGGNKGFGRFAFKRKSSIWGGPDPVQLQIGRGRKRENEKWN